MLVDKTSTSGSLPSQFCFEQLWGQLDEGLCLGVVLCPKSSYHNVGYSWGRTGDGMVAFHVVTSSRAHCSATGSSCRFLSTSKTFTDVN